MKTSVQLKAACTEQKYKFPLLSLDKTCLRLSVLYLNYIEFTGNIWASMQRNGLNSFNFARDGDRNAKHYKPALAIGKPWATLGNL